MFITPHLYCLILHSSNNNYISLGSFCLSSAYSNIVLATTDNNSNNNNSSDNNKLSLDTLSIFLAYSIVALATTIIACFHILFYLDLFYTETQLECSIHKDMKSAGINPAGVQYPQRYEICWHKPSWSAVSTKI